MTDTHAPTYSDVKREIKARLMFDEPPLAATSKKAEAITERVMAGLVKQGALVPSAIPADQPEQSSLDEFRADTE
ncbi:hypothetical protein GCM10027289_30150 [Tsukamurella serpentis]